MFRVVWSSVGFWERYVDGLRRGSVTVREPSAKLLKKPFYEGYPRWKPKRSLCLKAIL